MATKPPTRFGIICVVFLWMFLPLDDLYAETLFFFLQSHIVWTWDTGVVANNVEALRGSKSGSPCLCLIISVKCRAYWNPNISIYNLSDYLWDVILCDLFCMIALAYPFAPPGASCQVGFGCHSCHHGPKWRKSECNTCGAGGVTGTQPATTMIRLRPSWHPNSKVSGCSMPMQNKRSHTISYAGYSLSLSLWKFSHSRIYQIIKSRFSPFVFW